jgi:hypothetical protein
MATSISQRPCCFMLGSQTWFDVCACLAIPSSDISRTGGWFPCSPIQHAICPRNDPRSRRRQNSNDNADDHADNEGAIALCVSPHLGCASRMSSLVLSTPCCGCFGPRYFAQPFGVLHSLYISTSPGRLCSPCFLFDSMLTVSRFIENIFSLLGLLDPFRRSKTNRNQQGSFLLLFLLSSAFNMSAGKHGVAIVPHGRHHRQSDHSNRPQPLAPGFAVRAPHLFLFLLTPLTRWIVATTTIWSGLSYIFTKDAVRIISRNHRDKPPPFA